MLSARPLLLASLLLACGEPAGPDTTATATDGDTGTGGTAPTTGAAADGGMVRFTFTISAGARENLKPELPPKGTIHGSIFRAEDVAVTGPIEGAESVEGVRVDDVDLTTADVSAASYMSGAIAPGEYIFLGFFDLNDNGDDVSEPESGEPATLPTINKFTIETDKTIDYLVSFDIVL